MKRSELAVAATLLIVVGGGIATVKMHGFGVGAVLVLVGMGLGALMTSVAKAAKK